MCLQWGSQQAIFRPGRPLIGSIEQSLGVAAWVVFCGLLVALPLFRQAAPSQALAVFSFFRIDSLVIGGGLFVLVGLGLCARLL